MLLPIRSSVRSCSTLKERNLAARRYSTSSRSQRCGLVQPRSATGVSHFVCHPGSRFAVRGSRFAVRNGAIGELPFSTPAATQKNCRLFINRDAPWLLNAVGITMRCVLVHRFRDSCDLQRGWTSRGEREASCGLPGRPWNRKSRGTPFAPNAQTHPEVTTVLRRVTLFFYGKLLN